MKVFKNIKAQDILTGVLLVLIGVAIAIIFMIIAETHQPNKIIKTCNDGWSIQEEDGRIYESYIPENDTCKKGDK